MIMRYSFKLFYKPNRKSWIIIFEPTFWTFKVKRELKNNWVWSRNIFYSNFFRYNSLGPKSIIPNISKSENRIGLKKPGSGWNLDSRPVLFGSDVDAVRESDDGHGSVVEGEDDLLVDVDGSALLALVSTTISYNNWNKKLDCFTNTIKLAFLWNDIAFWNIISKVMFVKLRPGRTRNRCCHHDAHPDVQPAKMMS